MLQLKQSTAAVIPVYLADLTDGYTPETAVTAPTIYLTKNGGTPAVPSLGTWAELHATNMPGWYTVALDTTDTATLGFLGVDVIKTGTSRHFATVVQIVANIASDIKADTAAILLDTGTDGVVVPAATIDQIVDEVWDEATSGHQTAGTTGKALTSATAAADPWAVDLSTYADDTAGEALYRVTRGAGRNQATVTIQDTDDQPVAEVTVDVYDESAPTATAFVTNGLTDANGQVNFYLPTGTYYYWAWKRGYRFTQGVQLVVS
jgi:hypothetical protein